MQIHELNNFTGTLGSGAYLAIDDGTDTGKISSQGLLAATEARIDNIIAGPAPSAEEIVDARLGADGVTYPSLGDAIRDQFTDVKSALNPIRTLWQNSGMSAGASNQPFTFVQGEIYYLTNLSNSITFNAFVRAGDTNVQTIGYNIAANKTIKFVATANGDTLRMYFNGSGGAFIIEHDITKVLMDDVNDIYEDNSVTNRKIASLANGVQLFYGKFVRGSLTNGVISPEYLYRVSTDTIMTYPYDIKVKVASGFRYGIHYFVNGVYDSEIGWRTDVVTIPANSTFKATISRVTENTSEVADIYEFLSKVEITPTALDEAYSELVNFPIEKFRISHLFVDQVTAAKTSTITIPCQSVFDIEIAARLGFDCVEGNVHATATSGKYVVTHGISGKLGNDFENADGTEIVGDITIASTTYNDLRNNYRYRSVYPKYRVPITSLEEYLVACKQNGIIPLVQYVDDTMLGIVKSIVGKDFILYRIDRGRVDFKGWMTSYGYPDDVDDVIEACESYGKPFIYCLMNPSDFTDDELTEIIRTVHEHGYKIDTASAYTGIRSGVKSKSLGFDADVTQYLINTIESGNLENRSAITNFNDFITTGEVVNGVLILEENDTISVPTTENASLLAWNFAIRYNGTLKYLGSVNSSDGMSVYEYSGYAINGSATPSFTATEHTEVLSAKFVASKY